MYILRDEIGDTFLKEYLGLFLTRLKKESKKFEQDIKIVEGILEKLENYNSWPSFFQTEKCRIKKALIYKKEDIDSKKSEAKTEERIATLEEDKIPINNVLEDPEFKHLEARPITL